MDRRELVKKVGAVGALAAVPVSAAIPQPVAPAVDAEAIKESVIRIITDAVKRAGMSSQSPVGEVAPQSPGQTVFDGRVVPVLHERSSGAPIRVNPAFVTHYWGDGHGAVLRLQGGPFAVELTESPEEVDAILRW